MTYQHEVSDRAYFLAQEAGFPEGRNDEFWHQAELEHYWEAQVYFVVFANSEDSFFPLKPMKIFRFERDAWNHAKEIGALYVKPKPFNGWDLKNYKF